MVVGGGWRLVFLSRTDLPLPHLCPDGRCGRADAELPTAPGATASGAYCGTSAAARPAASGSAAGSVLVLLRRHAQLLSLRRHLSQPLASGAGGAPGAVNWPLIDTGDHHGHRGRLWRSCRMIM